MLLLPNLKLKNTQLENSQPMFVELDEVRSKRNINMSDDYDTLAKSSVNKNKILKINKPKNNEHQQQQYQNQQQKQQQPPPPTKQKHTFLTPLPPLLTTNNSTRSDFNAKKTYFYRDNLVQCRHSAIISNSTYLLEPFRFGELNPKRVAKMSKKLDELNMNSSLFVASTSSWTSLHRANSLCYLDNKFQNNHNTQHAKLAFYNHLLSKKDHVNNNYNHINNSSDFGQNADKNKSYLQLKELLGSVDSYKQSSESYDSDPDEQTTRKKDATKKKKPEDKLKRHISIKHFAAVENKYKSTPDNLNNMGLQPLQIMGNSQKHLFKIEETHKSGVKSNNTQTWVNTMNQAT